MTVSLELPEDIALELAANGRDLSRAALEAFAVEEYRARRLTDAQIRRLLNLSRFEIDALLKEHGVWLDYTVEDLEREMQDVK